jgi:hypothetical protein
MGDAPSYLVEPAKTGRSKCKGKCKAVIAQGDLRVGTLVEMPNGSSSWAWRCLGCVTPKVAQNALAKLGTIDHIAGFDALDSDQQAVVAAAFLPQGGGAAPVAAPAQPTIDVGQQHLFLDAAKEYDFDKVKKMLAKAPGLVDVQPAGRWSALHQAAQVLATARRLPRLLPFLQGRGLSCY